MTEKRQVKHEYGAGLKNMPQEVGYQKITQSYAATGKFKPRHFVIMGFVCVGLIQLVKFVMYSIFYRETSPEGLVLLLVSYLQIVLIFASFAFFVLAIYKALQNQIAKK